MKAEKKIFLSNERKLRSEALRSVNRATYGLTLDMRIKKLPIEVEDET